MNGLIAPPTIFTNKCQIQVQFIKYFEWGCLLFRLSSPNSDYKNLINFPPPPLDSVMTISSSWKLIWQHLEELSYWSCLMKISTRYEIEMNRFRLLRFCPRNRMRRKLIFVLLINSNYILISSFFPSSFLSLSILPTLQK